MFGKNPIRKPENHNGNFLKIQEIFYTIQGEGIYSGHPAVFVRLGGCNLACRFCDTEFETFQDMSIINILSEIKKFININSKKTINHLVVITGGEPLLQPIENLCKLLISEKMLIQIETNGTIFRDLPKEVKIICSPKISNNKYHYPRPDLFQKIDAFKFIISKTNQEYRNLPDFIDKIKQPIYLQPMDEIDKKKNLDNQQYALDLCLLKGYRLSLQIHKILKIR
ncbi:MAG: 7-carboxy-7-deazaguanine synthase QueE [Rickettsiales bacterium]|jgi:organic radical activating enzyme|nr:7-carboxy-7-deazaguanine synthase QueE [Rickettsiales bacterium]